jgi:regulatory protein
VAFAAAAASRPPSASASRGRRGGPGAGDGPSSGTNDGPGRIDGVEPKPRAPVDPVDVARQICLRQLEHSPRTRAELATVLRRKGVPDDAAEQVLSRFADVGMIDDALFARMWVTSRHRGKGLAGRALSQELRRKGVADDEVADAVASLDPEQELATARALVERRLRSTAGLPTEARVRRLAGMLARKGYPGGLAFRVVKEALAAEGEEAELAFNALSALDDVPVEDQLP